MHASPITHTREGNLVCPRRTWQRTCAAVTTDSMLNSEWPVLAGLLIECYIQTRAIQSVVEASMEVAFQATFDMADVCPATVDTRIAQPVIRQARINRAHLVSNRCSNLTTVGHIADVSRTNVRIILAATTGDAARIGYYTEQIQVSIT